MVNFLIDAGNSEVKIGNDENNITISFDDIAAISSVVDMEYYKKDVIDAINSRIEDGELPETAAFNEEYINAVADEYAENMETIKGENYGLCLDNAFDFTFYKEHECREEDLEM